jgi:hypothetical protein
VIQESAASLQELMPQLDISMSAGGSATGSLQTMERGRASLGLKIRSTQMALHKVHDSIRALGRFTHDLAQQSHIASLAAQGVGQSGLDGDAAKVLKTTAGQLEEALNYLGQEMRYTLSLTDEVVQLNEAQDKLVADAMSQTSAVATQNQLYKDSLLAQYSKLQTAAFQAGRLALLLLDVSADIMETEKTVSSVKYITEDISETSEDMRRLKDGREIAD